jgi:hypothetical protein
VEVIAVIRAAVVRYATTREAAQRNRELIENVLNELAVRDDGGIEYQVLVFDDGVEFMHIVAFDGTADPFADCAAYYEFHRELAGRLATAPVVTRATMIGSYRGRSRAAAMSFDQSTPPYDRGEESQ